MLQSNSLVLIVGLAIVVAIVVVVIARRRTQPASANSALNPMDYADLRLLVEDVFAIEGRGVVVTGRVESGTITVGQQVAITSADGTVIRQSTVAGLERSRKKQQSVSAGNEAGVKFDELEKEDVQPGMVITAS